MKLFTPEKIELLEVKSLSPSPEGLVIDGQIMGTMPMKAVLTPQELRRALRFLTLRNIVFVIGLLFRR